MAQRRLTALLTDAARLPAESAQRWDPVEVSEPPTQRSRLRDAAFDALEIGVLVAGQDRAVLLCNQSMQTSLGIASAALLGRPLTTHLLAGLDVQLQRPDRTPWPEDDWPLHEVLRTGVAARDVHLVMIRGGQHFDLSVSARPLHEPGEQQPAAVVASFTDVTGRDAAGLALQESEAHFRLLAENSTDVITRHAVDGTCLYASPSLRDVVGREPHELEGTLATTYVHPEDRDRLVSAVAALLHSGEVSSVRYRLTHDDGSWVWVETVIRPVRADGRVLELQSSTRDVSARVDSEQRLARLALADSLTGLANRAALLQHLEDLQGEALALLYLDLDRFKPVNDTLGHSAGDELLRTVARRVTEACREQDVVARLGGDEFVVVASGLPEDRALQLCERVQTVLSAPVQLGGQELVVGGSIGLVVTREGDERDAEQLLRAADLAMYSAKSQGRGRAVLWSAGDDPHPPRLTLEQQLRTALSEGQLEVHYQPQVDLASGRIVGVEALVRWAHPEQGLLLPAQFLDVADDSGLLVELGRQVLRQAVGQLAGWRRLPGHDALGLSVNLATCELLAPHAREAALDALSEAGLPTEALTLEILETVLFDRAGAVVRSLCGYADCGIKLALDDFGAGSSSLRHLRQVPVAAIKIDREFVDGLGSSRADEAIVRSLGRLSEELDLTCVAEGVERPAQRDWLLDQGIALAQGFGLHRPLPAAELARLLSGAAPAAGA